MKRNRVILFVSLALASLAFILFYCGPIEGYDSKYELHPQINLPEYGFAPSPTIAAYERLMDRYITLTELNIIRIDNELGDLSGRLEAMDLKLAQLSQSLDRIEKALGIQQPAQQGSSRTEENQQ